MSNFRSPIGEIELGPWRIWHTLQDIEGEPLFVPRYISYNKPYRGWRVMVNNWTKYVKTRHGETNHDSLVRAYEVLMDYIELKVPLHLKCPIAPAQSKVTTGITGLLIAQRFSRPTPYITVRASQSQNGRYQSTSAGHIVMAELTQARLDRALCIGLAMRWEYLKRRKRSRVYSLVRQEDIDPAAIPDKPIYPVTVASIVQWQADWMRDNAR